MDLLHIIIPDRLIGQRIDVAIAQLLPDYSRSKIITWIKTGKAIINHKTFAPKNKVIGGEIVDLQITTIISHNWLAEDIAIDVVFADDDIIVVNKPAGLVTHPGSGNWTSTLANALLHYDKNLANLARAGIVHRLDKDTSGLMVVARSEIAQKKLVEQLQNHTITREYSAIVYGYMIAGGVVQEPIGRDTKNRVKQAVIANGKDATTHYRVIERFAHHTHVKAILETGRTHQIRVHMSHIGHALIGDYMYGGKVHFPKKAQSEIKNALTNFRRQALHAKKLTLIHPVSAEEMSWKAKIPQDMQDLINILSKYDKPI